MKKQNLVFRISILLMFQIGCGKGITSFMDDFVDFTDENVSLQDSYKNAMLRDEKVREDLIKGIEQNNHKEAACIKYMDYFLELIQKYQYPKYYMQLLDFAADDLRNCEVGTDFSKAMYNVKENDSVYRFLFSIIAPVPQFYEYLGVTGYDLDEKNDLLIEGNIQKTINYYLKQIEEHYNAINISKQDIFKSIDLYNYCKSKTIYCCKKIKEEEDKAKTPKPFRLTINLMYLKFISGIPRSVMKSYLKCLHNFLYVEGYYQNKQCYNIYKKHEASINLDYKAVHKERPVEEVILYDINLTLRLTIILTQIKHAIEANPTDMSKIFDYSKDEEFHKFESLCTIAPTPLISNNINNILNAINSPKANNAISTSPQIVHSYINTPKKENTPSIQFILSPPYRKHNKATTPNLGIITKPLEAANNVIFKEITPSFEFISRSESPRYMEELCRICLSCGNKYHDNGYRVVCEICSGLLISEAYTKILNKNYKIKTDHNANNFAQNYNSKTYEITQVEINLNDLISESDNSETRSDDEMIGFTEILDYTEHEDGLNLEASVSPESHIEPFYIEPGIDIFKDCDNKNEFVSIHKDISLEALNFNDQTFFNGVDQGYLMHLLRHGYLHAQKIKERAIIPVISITDKKTAGKILACTLGKGLNIRSLLKKRSYDLFPQILPTNQTSFSYCNLPLLKDRKDLEKYEEKICVEFLNYLALKFAKEVKSVLFIASEADFAQNRNLEALFKKCSKILTSMFAQDKIWKVDSIDKDLKNVFKAAKFCVLVDSDKKQVLDAATNITNSFIRKVQDRPHDFTNFHATKLAQYAFRYNNVFFMYEKEYDIQNRMHENIIKTRPISRKILKCFWGPTVKNMAKNIASVTFFKGISVIHQLLYNQHFMPVSDEKIKFNIEQHKKINSLQSLLFDKIKKLESHALVLNKKCDKLKKCLESDLEKVEMIDENFIKTIASECDDFIESIKKVEDSISINLVSIESQQDLLNPKIDFLDKLNFTYKNLKTDDTDYLAEYIPEINECRCEFNGDIDEVMDNSHIILHNIKKNADNDVQKYDTYENNTIKYPCENIMLIGDKIEKKLILSKIEELDNIKEVLQISMSGTKDDITILKNLKGALCNFKEYFDYLFTKINNINYTIQVKDTIKHLGALIKKSTDRETVIYEEKELLKAIIERYRLLIKYISNILMEITIYEKNKQNTLEKMEDRYRRSLIYGYLKGYLAAEVLLEYTNFDYYDTEKDFPQYSKNARNINTDNSNIDKSRIYVAKLDFNLAEDLYYNLNYVKEEALDLHTLFCEYNKNFHYDIAFLTKMLHKYGQLHGFARFKRATDLPGNISNNC